MDEYMCLFLNYFFLTNQLLVELIHLGNKRALNEISYMNLTSACNGLLYEKYKVVHRRYSSKNEFPQKSLIRIV